MSTILSFFSGGWSYVLTAGAFIVAAVGAYIGGKKIGTTQTQAKADVTAAKVQSDSVAAVAKKQTETSEAVKNVQTTNSSLSDDQSRERMRNSQFNSKD